MTPINLALVSLVLAVASSGVRADPTPAVPQPVAQTKLSTTPRPDPNAQICHLQDVTGSRLGANRVCHTRQEWTDISAESRYTVQRAQQQTVAPRSN